MGGQEIEEGLAVSLRNRDVLLAEDDAVAFDRADLRRLDDVRAVDADEAVGGELLSSVLRLVSERTGCGSSSVWIFT